jgi:hypothetical protein
MAESMIERIATVLMEMNQGHDVAHYTDGAYYILREIRHPTEAMKKVGNAQTWESMIDEALEEPAPAMPRRR